MDEDEEKAEGEEKVEVTFDAEGDWPEPAIDPKDRLALGDEDTDG